jgi:hypothetical protein
MTNTSLPQCLNEIPDVTQFPASWGGPYISLYCAVQILSSS